MALRYPLLSLALAACSSSSSLHDAGISIDAAMRLVDAAFGDGGTEGDASTAVSLVNGTYRGTCDGSAGVSLDATHFFDFDDEDQVASIFVQGADGTAIRTQDLSTAIGLQTSDEADLEDAARVGDRVYVMGSHGRNSSGTLETSRYKLFAADISGTTLTVAGTNDSLLSDMLEPSSWTTPDADVIATIDAASDLSKTTVAKLAPKVSGTNIEGFSATGTPGTFLVGFRNPLQNNKAIVVTMLDVDATIAGASAHFGEAVLLDLGGVGIRGMAWSETLKAVFLVSGPIDGSDSPFALWRWSGNASDAPTKVQDLVVPVAGAHPEAIIPYAGTKDLQITYDMGSSQVAGGECKGAASSAQYFSDAIVHVD